MSRRLLPLALLACALLLLPACGGGGDDEDDGPTSEPAPASSNPETGDESLAMADARAALQDLLDALADEDAGKACDQLTDAAKAQLSTIAGGASERATPARTPSTPRSTPTARRSWRCCRRPRSARSCRTATQATAAVTIAGRTADVRLVEKDGKWLVEGLPSGS